MTSSREDSRSSSSSKRPSTVPQWRDAVAGAGAGAFSRTVMAPIERVKLLKQLQGSTTTSQRPTVPPESAWRVASLVYREQGLLSFWRGNLPNVLRVSGTAALNFTCMDYYKRVAVAPFFRETIVQRHYTTKEALQRRQYLVTSFVSGGLAGATSTTLLYPIEFVRTRLAMDMGSNAQTRQYTGMSDVITKIMSRDGISGLYQGYGIALFGGIFYRILLLGGYDAIKSEVVHFKKQRQHADSTSSLSSASEEEASKLTWGERIACAQVVSLTAGTASYPLDSVRRRLMMQAGQDVSERRYRNSFHCISTVFRTEGLRGFYLGLGPNILRSVGGALLLVGYDSFRSIL